MLNLRVLLLAIAARGGTARDVVSFDFGWRHRLGLHAWPLPPPAPAPPADCTAGASPFPYNRSGVQCFGLGADGNAHDQNACEKACCADAACALWQWRATSGCWRGASSSCSPADGWVGGARDRPTPGPPEHPDPGARPAEAQPGYADADWIDVQLPHDGLVGAAPDVAACPDGCSGRSYIPRHVLWYRKVFALPAAWAGSAVWLDFGAAFRLAWVYVNGALVATHDCGYTPFRVRLDNISSVAYGGNSNNTIAVFVDPDNGDEGGRRHGSGWWYEGGGIYRNVDLVRAPPVHVAQDGLFVYSNVTLGDRPHGPATAVVVVSAEIANTLDAPVARCVRFELTPPDSEIVAAAPPPVRLSVPARSSATAKASAAVGDVQLWTAQSPVLYKLTATLYAPDAVVGCGDGTAAAGGKERAASRRLREGAGTRAPEHHAPARHAPLDVMATHHGFRTLR